jgi:nucleotide-binding universal stress UspA family protein
MLKRILVALDRDTDTPVAIRHAIKLADAFDASLTGLAVVDLEAINSVVGRGGIGTIHYAQQLKSNLTEESREEAGKLLKNFKEMVKTAGVKHSKFMHEGVPHERIIEDSKYHDLLVIGRESHFFYNRPQVETKTLANIVKKGAGPTLMVTDSYRPIHRVVVAHDGSKASADALQWFVQLEPFGRDIEIDLVYSCNKKKEEAADQGKLILHLAYDYLKAHGYEKVNELLLDDKGGAGKQIIKHVNDTDADLVIIGAHSVSAIRRLTFGSVTHELVKNSPVPLFLSS